MTDDTPAALAEPEVLVEVTGGTGVLTLNRPRAINALTHQMVRLIQTALDDWRDSSEVNRVELRGAGERGFCAGADVRILRQQVLDDPALAQRFFEDEYRLNAAIARYPKPVLAQLSGITMGGGVGLSIHAGARAGDASTTIAMPEVTIGLFPDVGSLFPISRMPGQTGAWFVMTGASLDAASARWAGLLTETDELETHPDDSWLAQAQGWIDDCFAGDDPAVMVDRLLASGVADARAAGELIVTKSPLSVAVSLEALRRAAQMSSVDHVLAQDLRLVTSFMAESDFTEGVRAQVVDKDRRPRWRHSSLADVSRDEVQSYFG